jgi:hypothetical protein
VEEPPIQTKAGFAVGALIGVGYTVTGTVAKAVQLKALVPITV